MMRMMAAIAISIACALPALAEDRHDTHGTAAGASALSSGEVRKVDKAGKRITIKHGPLKNLDMPAMTMVFKVEDPAMLERVKAGDKVKFQAENVGGALTVTRIAPAK